MLVDYGDILKSKYPNKLWGGSGATYDRIVWKDGVVIPQAELETHRPAVTREHLLIFATSRLDEGYKSAADSGFVSTALGTPHVYPSKAENQLDILGSTLVSIVAPTATIPFPCFDLATNSVVTAPHTSTQWQQVFLDGVAYKQDLFAKYGTQKAGLSTLTDAQLETITFVK